MITRLEATRYRCFERLGMDLGSLCILVGANGSGKTTLLDMPTLIGDLLTAKNLADPFLLRRGDLPPRAGSLNKRPCGILVADSNMAATFRGYFKRERWHLSLGCAPFEINTDVGADLLVDEGGNDPGVYTKGHELLRPYQRSHHRALVVLDCEWDGSPGKEAIVTDITANLVSSGWAENAVKVIAIEPELENWLWQDKPQVADVLRYKGDKSLRQHLAESGWWPADAAKPPRPKEAAEWVLKQTRQPRSSAIYQKLAEHISIKGCTDVALAEMHAALIAWFPQEVAA